MNELREKNEAELIAFVSEKRTELRSLRFGVAGSSMRNTRAIRTIKKSIAQALTELTSRRVTSA
jgi:ribosomal protein L29